MANHHPPPPVFLPEKSPGQRKLVGYSHEVVAKSRTWLKRLSTFNTSVKDSFFSPILIKTKNGLWMGFGLYMDLKATFLCYSIMLNMDLKTAHCHPMPWLRMFLFNPGSSSYLEAGHTFLSLSFQYTDERSQRATISLEVQGANSNRV